ncbi:hypothetical protein OAH97_01435 [Octadecabacter sp.]|nr:hypothetical protein [Octadecabacter sp.]
MNFRKILSSFFNYQSEQSREAAEEVEQTHYQVTVHGWLDTSEEIAPRPLGWLGGKTPLSEEKPSSNRLQLCEIDCSQLPAEVWGGLGPRSGRLVFFLTLKGQISAEAVLVNDPAVPLPVSAHALKDVSWYYDEQDAYPDLMPALPPWPIRKGENQDLAETEGFAAPDPFSDLVLIDNRLKPQTLDQLKLLVEITHRELTAKQNERDCCVNFISPESIKARRVSDSHLKELMYEFDLASDA